MAEGHRKRLKARFLKEGLDGFEDHNALELLTFFSRPLRDTNPIGHALMEKFGSLSAVFDAPIEALMSVPGVGEQTAILIKLIPEMSRRYLVSRDSVENIITNSRDAVKYLESHYIGRVVETLFMLSIDAKGKLLACTLVEEGSINYVNIDPRKIIEIAIRTNAAQVIVAHNHCGGLALPSEDDVASTIKLKSLLENIGIHLTDHIIIANGDAVSLADSNLFGT